MAEITYCDDYEKVVGPKPAVETKVVTAPAATPATNATEAEVK